jgi:hypothetical protein
MEELTSSFNLCTDISLLIIGAIYIHTYMYSNIINSGYLMCQGGVFKYFSETMIIFKILELL